MTDAKSAPVIAGRPIPGFYGVLLDDSNVLWSCDGRRLDWVLGKKGYLQRNVWIYGRTKMLLLHRAIMLVHRYEPGCEKLQVDHVNGVRTDNRLENLRWVTAKENIHSTMRRGAHAFGAKNGRVKVTEEIVKWIRLHFVAKHPEFSGPVLARKFGLAECTLYRIISGEIWKTVEPKRAINQPIARRKPR